MQLLRQQEQENRGKDSISIENLNSIAKLLGQLSEEL